MTEEEIVTAHFSREKWEEWIIEKEERGEPGRRPIPLAFAASAAGSSPESVASRHDLDSRR